MDGQKPQTHAEIKEFLAEPVVARIATIDENGVPYVTPVWQLGQSERRSQHRRRERLLIARRRTNAALR